MTPPGVAGTTTERAAGRTTRLDRRVCDNTVVTALYRTYRSLDFTQVVGQEAVVRTLRNAIESDQVRQAYLFAGPRGTGKTSMARILAKALNAEGGPAADFDPTTAASTGDRRRDGARRRRDGCRFAARHRRGARNSRAGDAPAGGGPLQGPHRRRGASADAGRLERPAQADRGAATTANRARGRLD